MISYKEYIPLITLHTLRTNLNKWKTVTRNWVRWVNEENERGKRRGTGWNVMRWAGSLRSAFVHRPRVSFGALSPLTRLTRAERGLRPRKVKGDERRPNRPWATGSGCHQELGSYVLTLTSHLSRLIPLLLTAFASASFTSRSRMWV